MTPSDYERLTLENRQVNRARCLRPTVVNGPVRVLLVPAVDKPPGELEIDDFQLRDSLFHAVANHLDECRVLGTEIEVTTPFYVGVSVAALVRPDARPVDEGGRGRGDGAAAPVPRARCTDRPTATGGRGRRR